MDSGEILDRIKTLSKGVKISMPEKVFYSGPNHSEVAVYFGDKKKYTDLMGAAAFCAPWPKILLSC